MGHIFLVLYISSTFLLYAAHCHFVQTAAAAAKLLQLCPTLCDPRDSSQPGSPVPGILQARTLEWVAISFSNAWKWKVKVKSLSRVRLFVTPWTAAYQGPLSMGFSRQEYWSGFPLPSPTKAAMLRNPAARQFFKHWSRHFREVSWLVFLDFHLNWAAGSVDDQSFLH